MFVMKVFIHDQIRGGFRPCDPCDFTRANFLLYSYFSFITLCFPLFPNFHKASQPKAGSCILPCNPFFELRKVCVNQKSLHRLIAPLALVIDSFSEIQS